MKCYLITEVVEMPVGSPRIEMPLFIMEARSKNEAARRLGVTVTNVHRRTLKGLLNYVRNSDVDIILEIREIKWVSSRQEVIHYFDGAIERIRRSIRI